MYALVKYKNPLTTKEIEKYDKMSKLFFKYSDANNTQRVLNRVNELVFNDKK